MDLYSSLLASTLDVTYFLPSIQGWLCSPLLVGLILPRKPCNVTPFLLFALKTPLFGGFVSENASFCSLPARCFASHCLTTSSRSRTDNPPLCARLACTVL